MGLWLSGMLVFARLGGLFLSLPVVSAQGVPRYIAVLGAGALTMVLAPALPYAEIPPSVGVLMVGVATELVLGLLMGSVVSALFGSIALGCELMGIQIGFGMAALFNPFLKISSGALGTLASWLAGLVFLGTGLHLHCLEILGGSFALVPPGGAVELALAGPVVVEVVGLAIATGVSLAGPVLALVWLVNVFIAVLTRLAPRMNVYFSVGTVLTAAAGLGLYAAALPWMLTGHLTLLETGLAWMLRVLEAVNGG
ncbi:MAG TPA: flagellar biosynthetic protein FliR [Myxococcota bacterium]|nr:flagellar biosynthetic protein FliR [Myxococcota bacterium]